MIASPFAPLLRIADEVSGSLVCHPKGSLDTSHRQERVGEHERDQFADA